MAGAAALPAGAAWDVVAVVRAPVFIADSSVTQPGPVDVAPRCGAPGSATGPLTGRCTAYTAAAEDARCTAYTCQDSCAPDGRQMTAGRGPDDPAGAGSGAGG